MQGMNCPRRVLLIDDDERLGLPLAAFFARHGFELQQATRPSMGRPTGAANSTQTSTYSATTNWVCRPSVSTAWPAT